MAQSDLSARNPDYIRSLMPLAALAARLYFRTRAYGIENIPQDGPVIFVSNHSGGISTPDTIMVSHLFWQRFGADRPIYALVHPSIFEHAAMAKHILSVGGVAATSRNAKKALDAGASLLIYPGAGDEAYRTYWERHQIKLGQNSAYVRLAIAHDVPIVPVVCNGGHETLMVLNDGKALAQALGLDKHHVERVPLTYSFPWGLALGVNYAVPSPRQIDVAFGAPIHLRGFGRGAMRDRGMVDWCHAQVARQMQMMMDGLVARRHSAPVPTLQIA